MRTPPTQLLVFILILGTSFLRTKEFVLRAWSEFSKIATIIEIIDGNGLQLFGGPFHHTEPLPAPYYSAAVCLKDV
jgi:hypothetical protein